MGNKYRIRECDYHLCKKKTRVYQCEYCEEYFCKEHINPKPVGVPRFNSNEYEDRVFMEEWRKPGHPCVEYTEEWKKRLEKEKEEYGKRLDRFVEFTKIAKVKEKPVKRFEFNELALLIGFLALFGLLIIAKYVGFIK